MHIESLTIPHVKVITPKKFGDHRGFFSETWSQRTFENAGLNYTFVQDNHSMSASVGTVRGLHFQTPPFAQTKLVRCTRGRILDVVVDMRQGSPTFGEHVSVELSEDNWKQLLVPRGCAHGFVTLLPGAQVIYKVDNDYAPDHDAGILWCDPTLNIDWGINPSQAIVSDKDHKLPVFEGYCSPFVYHGEAS